MALAVTGSDVPHAHLALRQRNLESGLTQRSVQGHGQLALGLRPEIEAVRPDTHLEAKGAFTEPQEKRGRRGVGEDEWVRSCDLQSPLHKPGSWIQVSSAA